MAEIVDRYGNPIKSAKKPETREIAVVSIRDRWSTYPSERLTPERLARIFKEADGGDIYRQSELFEEMEEKDTHLASIMQTRKNSVLGLDWEVLPHSDSAEDKKVAAFITDAVNDIENLEDAFLDLLDAIGKGFAASEVMWTITGGKALIKELKWRHQKKFTFADSMELRLLTEEHQDKGIEIPENKFVVHEYRARSGHTSRAGVLRVCGWMYLFKNYSLKDWVAFAEVYGMPLRLGKYDQSTSEEDKQMLIQALMQLGTDAAGIISKSTEIEFVEATRGGQAGSADLYERLAEFCNREMSKAVLGQTLTTDVGSAGSYAASKTHGEVRQDLIEADAKALSKTMRKYVLAPLVYFNFGPGVRVPDFKFHYEPPEDQKSSAKTYATLVKDVGLPVAAEHLYEKFGIPAPDPNKHTIIGGYQGEREYKERVAFKEDPPTPNDSQDSIDHLASESWRKAIPVMARLTEPVLKVISEAQSFEEIEAKLVELYQGMDTGELEEVIAQAIFVADMFGRWSEDA